MSTNEMAASLKRDGFTPDEIANMCGPDTEQQPIQLRWGLDDVMWGDDDSVIVMLSGPDGEPYWLELDQERAAVLRQNLASPDGELDAVPVVAPATDRAAVLDDEAALIVRHCPDHGPQDQDGVWMDCHCAVAEDMRKRAVVVRRAADETPDEDEPTESVIYEVVGDWGVDSADSAEGARAAVAKWLRAYPKCGAYAQQRIVREWPDGSEYYGPWTDLPEPPAVGTQQSKEETRP